MTRPSPVTRDREQVQRSGPSPCIAGRAPGRRSAAGLAGPGPGHHGLVKRGDTVDLMTDLMTDLLTDRVTERVTDHVTDTVRESALAATSTRAQLVRAAAHLFREQGFHGTSVAQIATAAWITKSSLYHHFASKQALLAEILTETASRVTPAVEEIASADLPAAERLRAAARRHVVELIHDQDMVACFVEEGRFLATEYRDDFVAARDRYEQSFRRILEDGVRSGEFRPVSVSVASLAVLGMCNSVVHWYQPGGALEIEAVAEQFADLAVRSLLSGQADHPGLVSADPTDPTDSPASAASTASEGSIASAGSAKASLS
jgi:TetR/AcrR family transcriptional regulator, cholesterol catabolism regulator